ncbi:MAG TPA: CHRD domain-containing protein [Parvularculaceae bacterium]|nr:CHRD domain-containing protein [Parvularculaceae bacterium]
MRSFLLAIVAAGLFAAAPSHATVYTFTANLSGAAENPPNASPGSGQATVIFDDAAHSMEVMIIFADLLGPTTASHLHCCVDPNGNAGVATTLPTFTGFPLGVTSGSYDHIFDLTDSSSFNPTFVAANGGTLADAEVALLAGLLAGQAYIDMHTTVFPGGEIRGFLTTVPLPAAFWLFASGAAFLLRRRRAA